MIRLLLPLLLAGCVAVIDPATDLSAKTATEPDNALVARFSRVCLAGSEADVWSDLATQQGWTVADDVLLQQNGLAALRRAVLAVPGGGAHVIETQTVMQSTADGTFAALSIESQRSRDGGHVERCTIHAQAGDLLAVCASLGNSLARAPDRNVRYGDKGAQFVGWDMHHGQTALRIGCEQAAQSAFLAFDGIVLSATADLSLAAAAKPLSTPARASER